MGTFIEELITQNTISGIRKNTLNIGFLCLLRVVLTSLSMGVLASIENKYDVICVAGNNLTT